MAPSARYYEPRGRQPQKLTARARQAIGQVKRWVPHRALIFVADSSYAGLELLAWCQRLPVTLITPLRLDAALFALAPKPRPGQNGRPRLKGAALPKLAARLQNRKPPWQHLWVHWYGQGKRRLEVTTGTAVWYHAGQVPGPIRWVLGRHPLGRFEPQALLSSDPRQSAREIVELFTRRWQVEVAFEETRAHLGVETQRQWNSKAIQRATPVLLGLFSIVTLMAHHLQQHVPGALRVRVWAWYAKCQVSFSDALARVRAHLWRAGICLSAVPPDSRKPRRTLACAQKWVLPKAGPENAPVAQ